MIGARFHATRRRPRRHIIKQRRGCSLSFSSTLLLPLFLLSCRITRHHHHHHHQQHHKHYLPFFSLRLIDFLPSASSSVSAFSPLLLTTITTRIATSNRRSRTLLLSSSSSDSNDSSDTMIRRVVVVGGTHGNEYTGAWCTKSMETSAQQAQLERLYPSLDIQTLLGNPAAFAQNKRFVDCDLNREFSKDKLLDSNNAVASTEARRARELDALLGPKFAQDDQGLTLASNPKTDLIVDLHSTTSNMGITLIINEGDALMAQAAAYVMMKCRSEKDDSDNNNPGDGVYCLMHSIPDRAQRPNLSSTAKHGFTIEVGPVPQGVIRHDAVLKTQRALSALLEFCEQHNINNRQQSDNDESDMINKLLQEHYPNHQVPCYQSAPAVLPGEMSGKITWPSDDEHANFPMYMIHESRQDQDFAQIQTGDALFVSRDGSTIIPYNGSHGDKVHLIFINEGGYYYASSGTGIGVALARHYNVRTGRIVDHGANDAMDTTATPDTYE